VVFPGRLLSFKCIGTIAKTHTTNTKKTMFITNRHQNGMQNGDFLVLCLHTYIAQTPPIAPQQQPKHISFLSETLHCPCLALSLSTPKLYRKKYVNCKNRLFRIKHCNKLHTQYVEYISPYKIYSFASMYYNYVTAYEVNPFPVMSQ